MFDCLSVVLLTIAAPQLHQTLEGWSGDMDKF